MTVPAIEVVLQSASNVDEVPDVDAFERWIGAAVSAVRPGPAQVSVRLVDESESAGLNQRYRQRQGPTNVLSFPAPALPPGLPPEASAYLGDIVLCVPVLAREAAEQGKTLAAHYHHMVVHGMLHLQGMDHQTPDEAARMEAIESSILAGLGYPNPYDADPPARVLSPHPAGTAPDA